MLIRNTYATLVFLGVSLFSTSAAFANHAKKITVTSGSYTMTLEQIVADLHDKMVLEAGRVCDEVDGAPQIVGPELKLERGEGYFDFPKGKLVGEIKTVPDALKISFDHPSAELSAFITCE